MAIHETCFGEVRRVRFQMRHLRQTFIGRLVATALCAVLVLAVSFWVPESVVRGFGALGLTIAVLLGVLAIVVDACMARRPTGPDDAHELSPLVFPPSERRSGPWEMD